MWRVRRLFISLWLPEPTDKSDWKRSPLTLILLTWSIWWAPNNASKRQKGFSSVFKGLRQGKPPATIKFTQFFKFSTRYFCAILNTFRIASTDFHEVLLSNFTKIPWGGAALTHAERRSFTKKLICAFHNYENEPTNKKGNVHVTLHWDAFA